MNISCPICSQNTKIDQIKDVEEMEIRGEIIPVKRIFYRCENCGEEFEIHNDDYDPFDAAYREYRRRKGWVQPEEIKGFRESMGFTQKQFSNLLGIGIATLNRYENGALQSDSAEQLMEFFINDPSLIIQKLKQNPDLFSQSDRERIILRIRNKFSENSPVIKIATESFANYSESEFTGGLLFDFPKFGQAIKFFCSNDQVVKTKLLKLLFYSDFKHYKEFGTSITGAQYARINYGPVPDNYKIWLTILSSWMDEITSEETMYGEYIGETFIANDSPELDEFSTSEIEVLGFVKQYFKNFTAKDIVEFSHQEVAYQETQNSKLISYEYAKDLQI